MWPWRCDIAALTDVQRRTPWRLRLGDGLDVAGVTAGAGRPPVALLHGGIANLRWWEPVAALLAAEHEVTSWDHRGHGMSGPACGDLSVDRLADDALAVLAARGLREVVLAGHSLGATVALVAAAKAEPGRIAAVVCVEGGLYDLRLLYGSTWQEARHELCSVRRSVSVAVLEAWLSSAGLPPEALDALLGNFVDAGGGRLEQRLPAELEERLAHSLWAQDLSGLLAVVRLPVAVIAGDGNDDRATWLRRESLARARELLAEPLVEEWIPGGHHLPLQRPTAVAAAIRRFISSIGGGGVGTPS